MTAIEKALGSLAFTHDVSEARKELGDMKTEIASLREQLRLAQDKMAERERQARWDVAYTAVHEYGRENMRLSYLQRVIDANAPKD